MNLLPTRSLPVLLALAAGAAPLSAHDGGSSLPDHFEVVELGEFVKPVMMAFADDGTLFVASKRGRIFIHDGVAKQGPAFIDLRDEICSTGDRGLLGLELHPGFIPDGGPTSWVYMLYTVSPVFGEDPLFNEDDKHAFGRLVRYKAITAPDGKLFADAGTREVLIGNQLPDGSVPDAIPNVHSSHAIGTLAFGTDGSLLVTCGDGAHFDQMDPGGIDPAAFEDFVHPDTGLKGPMPIDQDCGAFRSQDMRTFAGKVLRIDPETGLGYPSNPFYDGDPASHASRVWALGLRNPTRAGFMPGTGSADPTLADPGTLLIGDVGWQDWEEINLCVGGENFGWPCFEGPFPEPAYDVHEYDPNPMAYPDCENLGPGILTNGIAAWEHDSAGLLVPSDVHVDEFGSPQSGFVGSCVIGGAVYPGGDYPPEYNGRYFFGDYADDWMRTAVIDPVTGVTELADFGFEVDYLVDMEAHPITGDIYFCMLGQTLSEGRVMRIRYGANLTPSAQFSATPMFGDLPLLVDFDASASGDPENDPLTYDWDFGDGNTAMGQTVQHTYAVEGLYTATLTVIDSGGLADTQSVQIAAGNVPPTVRILSPFPGTLFETPEELILTSIGTDFTGESLTYEWTVDLYHDTHTHPEDVVLQGQNVAYAVDPHGEVDELYYLRVEVRATNETGLVGSDHIFLYPQENVIDLAGTSLPISKMDELIPPTPTGTGNLDIEVIRDGDIPAPSSTDRQRQFDTYHDGAQGDDDWIGYELAYVPVDTVRFTSLYFQEGIHFLGGGWFETMTVEVRNAGVWEEVQNLRTLPDYPFQFALSPGFDGIDFQSYELQFDPIAGDAIRLRGKPGGADGYISVGELRVRLITPVPIVEPWNDITDGGSIIAKVFELTPPFPLGEGNLSPQVILNETFPPIGSQSKFAQVDTFHNGDQNGEDFVGYTFNDWRLFSRVLFQEGHHYPNGGWFDTATVEVRAGPGEPWEVPAGLSVTPSIPADTSMLGTYESFVFEFDPVIGREIRVIGDPGGVDEFISIGELRVFEPGFDSDMCGWTIYGEDAGGNNLLTLESATPPILGAQVVLNSSSNSVGSSPGWLAVGAAPTAIPILGGSLLVDFSGGLFDPVSYNGAATFSIQANLPTNPAFVGQSFYLQALRPDPLTSELHFSNGLELRICP